MPKFLDRTGMRYGRLIVVSLNGKDARGRYIWLCECDCGNKKIVNGNNLSSNKSKSCGCLKKEFLSKSGNQFGLYIDRKKAILKRQYAHLKRRHTKKNMVGNIINFETFKKLSLSKCHYCGLEYSKKILDNLMEIKNAKLMSDTIIYCNGIDRISNNLGYTKENSVACCSCCNFAKHTMNKDEFLKWIKKVYEYNFIDEEL